ncbi:MAG: transglutaminase domain-containing protein [Oscillospiraceae bacterium]|nr:transglutaminase domain-containing protein [Oscillospiraceae bacterium]
MKFSTKKIIAALTAVTLILSGCSPKSKDSKGSENEDSKTSSKTTASLGTDDKKYGAQISVEDIKKLYNETESNDVMPLNNVAPDEAFDFNFRSDLNEADDFSDFVTVHTDRSCSEESKIITFENMEETPDGGSKVTVSPCEIILATDSEEHAEIYNDTYTWGNASIYYISVNYDMESDKPVRLENPVIIPFTVKHELPAPNVKGVVDNTGRFKLVWDPVEGATSYNIYTLSGDGQTTGQQNLPLNATEKGFKECYLVKDSETTDTEFDNFAGEGHGLAVHSSSSGNGDYVIGQNYCVNGDYYVSAVIGDKESGFSAGVQTADLIIPYEPTDECDIMFNHYDSVADLPLTLDIVNIDGSVTSRNVLYTFQWGSTLDGIEGNSFPQYSYQIEGTALTGFVSMDDDLSEYPPTVGNASTACNQAPEDNVPKTPDPDVDTIITPEDLNNDPDIDTPEETQPAQTDESSKEDESSETETTTEKEDSSEAETTTKTDDSSEAETTTKTDDSSDAETTTKKKDDSEASSPDDKTLVEQQQENTQNHIENANSQTVANTDESYLVFADSAAEEWFARNMMDAQTEFSIEGFPEMQDPNLLIDTLLKVTYQNPYILGVKSYGYDYNTMTVRIDYEIDADTIKKQQGEIAAEASKVVSEVIKDGMSDEEKRMALYKYLEDNCKYDDAALENAQANDFKMTDDNTFADSFSTYGILVKKVGVCKSYAFTYKLLCEMSGIDCMVVTGNLNGNLPHAWNAVKIDNQWFMTDTTNNANVSGIPYMLYDADSDISELTGFTIDDTFDLDSNLESYNSDNDQYEYYYANDLVATDLSSYSEILDKVLTPDSKTVCIRYVGDTIDTEELGNAIVTVYNKHGMEDALQTLGLAAPGGFLVIMPVDNQE